MLALIVGLLVVLSSSTPTIRVQSSLTRFKKDSQLDDLSKEVHETVEFENVQELEKVMEGVIKGQNVKSTNNIRMLVEGIFQYNTVKVSESFSFTYEELLSSWTRLRPSNRIKLEIWLRGSHSEDWIDHCISSMDFDEVEIVVFYESQCRVLGGIKYGLIGCTYTEVTYSSHSIDGAVLITYQLLNPIHSNLSIINLNFKGKAYINLTSNRAFITAKAFHEYGTIESLNLTLTSFVLKRPGRTINLNSSSVTSVDERRSLAEVYNFAMGSYYYGGWRNGTYSGMGHFSQTQFKYCGHFKQGMRDGQGIIADCNITESPLCDTMLRERTLGEGFLQGGRLFIGEFQRNVRKRGVFREGTTMSAGKYHTYRYTNTVEGRPQIYIKMAGFGLEYKISTAEIRRRGGMFVEGKILQGVEMGTLTLRNYSGTFDSAGNAHKGIFCTENETLLSTKDPKSGEIVGMFFSKSEDQEVYFGRFDRYGKKTGPGVSHRTSFSYWGQHKDDMFHGYGNLTEYDNNRSQKGQFQKQIFVQGVRVEKVDNRTQVSEGYFINNRTTADSIVYVEGSGILTRGNPEAQTIHLMSPAPASFVQVVATPNKFSYIVITESQQ